MEKSVFVKNSLIESASKLSKVSEASLKEYVDKREMLAAKMNEVMLKREDILGIIGGKENLAMMKDNHNNHLQFVTSILQRPDPETLVDTVLWVFHAYMSRGYSSEYFSSQMNTWKELLEESVSKKAFSEIFGIYDWFNVNIPNFVIVANEKLEKSKHMDND